MTPRKKVTAETDGARLCTVRSGCSESTAAVPIAVTTITESAAETTIVTAIDLSFIV
jgi:hypothetical protein